GLLLTIVFASLKVSAAAATISFNIDNVASLAKQLAAEPFKPPQSIPDFLKQLSYDDYRDIRFDLEQAIWKDTGSNFQVQLIHPGLYYANSVVINTYDTQGIRRETRHELRPNAWITPIGNWGKGQIKLVEIPSPRETNDNIVAYWVPRNLPPPGQPIEISYRMSFQSEDPLDSASGRVSATRVGVGDKEDVKRFILDFDGGRLKSL